MNRGLLGIGQTPSVLEGVTHVWRGHSYVAGVGAAQPQSLAQYRIASRFGLPAPVAYAAASSRSIELLYDALNTVQASSAGAIAGSVCGVDLRGIVVIDALANDMFGWTGSVYSPASPTALRVANFRDNLIALMALISAKQRVETEVGVKTGVWTNVTATDPWSGRTLNFTTAQNAKYDTTVPFTAAGKCWHIGYGLSSGATGAWSLSVDGASQVTGASATLAEGVVSQRGTGTTYTAAAIPSLLTGSSGNRVCTILKTDAAAGPVYSDVFLPVSTAPPLIVVIKDPIPAIGSASSPFLSAQNITDITTAYPTWTAAIDAAVAQFPNAVAVDASSLSSTSLLSSIDGVHPNDRGYAKLADLIQFAIAAAVPTWSAGVHRL